MRASVFRGFANNKDADKPVHPRRLISACADRFLKSIVFKLQPKSNVLASLCSQGDWFETRFVRNPKDRLCRMEAHEDSTLLAISVCNECIS